MQPQQGGTGSCMDDMKRWWGTVPCGVKFIYYSSIGSLLLGFFLPIFNYLIICSPHFIMSFQIWRMFTAQFYNDLLGLIFGLLSLTFTGIMLEKSIGTISFIIDFMFKNFLIQLLHFIMILLLNLIFQTGTIFLSYGLFNIVILYMSLRCFSDPQTETNFLCFPFQLKNKYQPFAILVFFTLIGGVLRYDFVAAVILGFVEVHFYGGMMLRLSAARIASLKNSLLFKSMSTRSDFIDPNAPFLVQTAAQSSSQSSAPQTINNFSGRGVTIGGAPNQPIVPQQHRPNQQQYVINPSQQEQQQQQDQAALDFQQFAGKGVSIGGVSGGNTLSIQQQREQQMKRLMQQQQNQQSELEQSGDNKIDLDTNADTSNESGNLNERKEQKNQQKKDGYTALNEDLL